MAVLCVLIGPIPAAGQPPAAVVADAPQAPDQPTLQAALPLEGPSALVFHVVKADKAADFEGLFARLRTALAASAVAARREQGAGWRLFKQNAPTAEGHLIYVSMIDPVVAGQEYDIARLLAEAYPDEGTALYQTLLGAHVQPTVQASNLTGVTGAPAPPPGGEQRPADVPPADPPPVQVPPAERPIDEPPPDVPSDEDPLR
jgi:hypothetical protein